MGKIQLHCKTITLAILYLAVPICLFFLFWLKLPLGLLCTALLVYACYRLNREVAGKYQELPASFANELAIAFLIVFLYLLFTGHGSFIGSEGYDIPWRNAIYQDLIHQPWPVFYEVSQSALVYYLVYWLVPAGISHIFNFGDVASNGVLVLWTYLGLRIFLQLLLNYLKVQKQQVILVTCMFLFWSGLSFVGMMIINSVFSRTLGAFSRWGWDTWWYTRVSWDFYPMHYMVRTVFDSLGNIYNQFTPILLGLILFMFSRQIKYYALIGLLVLPFSPFGFLGLFVIMFTLFIIEVYQGMKKGTVGNIMREAGSRENILAALTIFPIFLFYFTCNNMSSGTINYFSAPLAAYGIKRIAMLILYYFLQFGIYLGLVYKSTSEKKLWWIILLSLMLFPLFRIGYGFDLCFNGSIASFYLLMILVMQHVLELLKSKQLTKQFCVVYTVLIIGALTPLQQMSSQLGQCIHLQIFVVRADQVDFGDTIANVDREGAVKDFYNFLCLDYQDKAFYKYLAKKH